MEDLFIARHGGTWCAVLGIGGIIGSGVFVLTGVASREHAGCAADA